MFFKDNQNIFLLFCIVALIGAAVFCLLDVSGVDQALNRKISFDVSFFPKVVARILDIPNEIASTTQQFLPQGRYLKDYSGVSKEFLANKTDFLEINFSEMKVRVLKNGELSKEVDILMRGDPFEWGGTASGVYKVNKGYMAAYSVVAEVYMPYALGFYGKYYLHGEPYYPSGEKRITDASGGCVQLADEDAKEIYDSSEINMPVVVVDKMNDDYQYPKIKEPAPEISAQSYLVADLDSGFVMTEKNSQEKWPIASLTKLMTAIILAENIDLRKSIVVNKSMLLAYGESEAVKEGNEMGVVELFYPLMIESSNDAAEALSGFLGRQRIIEMMNEKAKSMLMPDTSFDDVSGYSPKNISTAQDLFYLARYVLNNRPLLWQITKSQRVKTFVEPDFDIAKLWNKNVFKDDASFVGGKTGFIKESMYNGIFIFQFEDKQGLKRNIAIILLGSECLECNKTDAQKIYIWLQQNYFKLAI